jgi:hypothetical protein
MTEFKALRPPSTLFGLPLVMKGTDAEELLLGLEGLWKRQMGSQPSGLAHDLEALGKIFHPRRREASIRSFVESLDPPPTIRAAYLESPLIIRPHLLVTPEGRIAIQVLRELERKFNEGSVIIAPDFVGASLLVAYEVYKDWSLHRIERVLGLHEGKGERVHPAALGVLLWLLVNRSTTRERALNLEALSPDNRARVRAAIGRTIDAFVDALSKSRQAHQPTERFDDWPLSEARRRVGSALTSGDIYVREELADKVLQTVAAEVSSRASSSKSEALEAFDRLVEAYRRELPTLAPLDIAHESGGESRRLRQRLGALLVDLNRPT